MSSFPVQEIRQWFFQNQRSFPWREDCSAYAVWISEVMLQQTRAAVVIPYFLRWMQRFPTIATLAKASVDEVIKLWEGLGYYSRARNLHLAAQKICCEFGGEIPRSEEALKTIPGLGPYTIGAIRSFAFHEKVSAIDGNVMRVLSRFFCIEEAIERAQTKKQMQRLSQAFLPDEEPWIVAEALIELGATVCTAKPRCRSCPLVKQCQAFAKNCVESLPVKAKKQATQKVFRAVPVILSQGKFLIRRIEKGQIMSDLHEFPYFETGETGICSEELQRCVEMTWGIRVKLVALLQEVKHSFTRYVAHLRPVVFTSLEASTIAFHEWVAKKDVLALPFSSGHRRILRSVLLQESSWLPIV